ncbi:hypothetical protein [Rhizobium leguminosarum]|uniref:hypothetical protein n=1 Tax=Rhizobium leguminosarum TaxID=384 RepID=UPI001649FE94|nr:hypothetical protein [Rhizobium leguminosarum]
MTWGTFKSIQQLVGPDEANAVENGEEERKVAEQDYMSGAAIVGRDPEVCKTNLC